MRLDLSLQELFVYSKTSIIFLSIIVLFLGRKLKIFNFKFKNRKKKKEEQDIIQKVAPKKVEIATIKSNYLDKINNLIEKINNNSIESREAYQELSLLIRNFVYEVTGIEVQNCTLEDINKMNLPILYELVKDYYSPEFEYRSIGDINASTIRTKEVIEKWQ